jgi:hypothetical protein
LILTHESLRLDRLPNLQTKTFENIIKYKMMRNKKVSPIIMANIIFRYFYLNILLIYRGFLCLLFSLWVLFYSRHIFKNIIEFTQLCKLIRPNLSSINHFRFRINKLRPTMTENLKEIFAKTRSK